MCPLLILIHSSPCDPAGWGPPGPVPAQRPVRLWSVVARLPLPPGRSTQPGVAGPFAGVSGHALIVAGGSNFPDKKPWEGGRKEYVDEVYILTARVDAADMAYQWYTGASFRLPQKVAYGASVTTPGGIVCIGGETATGFSKKVFLLQWDPVSRRIRFNDLPDLPAALANAGAASIGQTVYVAGGENAEHALAGLFSLDLARPTGWQRLPDVPLAVSHCAVVAQGGALFVIGGRSKTASGVSTLHNTVFRYDPLARTWQQMHSIGDGVHPPHLAAANAVADDNGGILVIGGDDGRIFHELETLNARIAAGDETRRAASDETRRAAGDDSIQRRLRDRKLAVIGSHPGFWRGILRYDVVHDRWTAVGELPMAAPVTTTAVRWGNAVVIPCGEVKPGTRSADILMAAMPAPGAAAMGNSIPR